MSYNLQFMDDVASSMDSMAAYDYAHTIAGKTWVVRERARIHNQKLLDINMYEYLYIFMHELVEGRRGNLKISRLDFRVSTYLVWGE